MDDKNNSLEAQTDLSVLAEIFDKNFVARIMDVPSEIFQMTEDELESHFSPTSTDYLIRRNIHRFIAMAKKSGDTKSIHTKDIFRGLCTSQNFYTKLLKNQYRLTWWLIPHQEAAEIWEAGFSMAAKKVIKEVLSMPVTDKNAGTILKALQYFSDRHIGPIVQKIDQRSVNMNIDSSRTVSDNVNLDPEALLEKYHEAQRQLESAKKVIDVTDVEEEKG